MAGKIPEVEQTVSPTGPRVTSPTLGQEADVSAGLNAAGRALGQAADVAQKFAAEADAVRVTEALVDFERRNNERLLGKDLDPIDAAFEGTRRKAGFLESRGTAAGQASREVTDGVESDVQDIANKLLPRQREAFLQRARQLQISSERRITEHVVREAERAKTDILKAAQSETIRAIGEDPRSPAWLIKSQMVEESIRTLATTKEGADAAVADWQGQVALQQINALLKSGDTTEAEARFADTRHLLGDAADDVEALIKRAREADKVKDVDLSALETAQKWVLEAKPKGGYVIGTAKADLLTKLEESPVDAKREKLQQHVQRLIAIEQDRFEADRSNHRNLVAGPGTPPPTSVVWLTTFDREWYEARVRHQNDHWRMLQDRKANDPRVRAAADKKLADMREIFKNEFAALPFDEQIKKTPEEFAVELAQRKPGFVVDDVALSRARAHQRGTIEREKAGDLKQEEAVRTELNRDLPKLLLESKGAAKGKPKATTRAALEAQGAADEDAVKFAVGNALDKFRDERAAKGRDLTPAEMQQFLSTQKADTLAVKKPGLIFDSTVRVPGALERRVAPAVPPVPAGSGNQPPSPTPEEMVPVDVKLKDGSYKPGKVPRSKLEAALKAGAVKQR